MAFTSLYNIVNKREISVGVKEEKRKNRSIIIIHQITTEKRKRKDKDKEPSLSFYIMFIHLEIFNIK